jgi:hypothetical protein
MMMQWLVGMIDKVAFDWVNRRMWAVYGEKGKELGGLDKEVKVVRERATPNGFDAVFKHPIVPLFATEIAGLLEEANTENYVEIDFGLPLDRSKGRKQFVRMTVQWADGLSPAEKASKLEKEVAMLQEQLAQKEERYQQLFAFARKVFSTHFDGGIADDDIEVIGREHKLLERVPMTAPCGEMCNCEWLMDEGEEWDCNIVVSWLWDGDTAVADSTPKRIRAAWESNEGEGRSGVWWDDTPQNRANLQGWVNMMGLVDDYNDKRRWIEDEADLEGENKQ